ncbi:MAG TPA: sigma-70 family RNA polymerase sigma factor [Opitutaceae bacterium]|nr:sigma-70 family RNA polymerase sigma factor [Opitutaceae bacterium]
MNDDAALLRRYADEKSEAAFAEFVRRHLDLVYSAALRRLGGDTHRAADVAQRVFTRLARDAAKLSRHEVLTAWLYAATRNAAIDLIRSEQRHRAHEQEASIMQDLFAAPPDAEWEHLRPVLDAAMDELAESDRTAVLLRFFENRPFAQIGAVFQVSEDAARMRVDRALGRLRAQLAKRGITSTAVALSAALASHTIGAAPEGLATAITGTALANAAADVGSAIAWARIFTMTNVKIGIVSTVVVAGMTMAIVELQTSRALSAEIGSLRAENEEVVRLQTENLRLAAATTSAVGKISAARKLPPRPMQIAQVKSPTDHPAATELKPAAAWRNVGIATPAAAYETQLWAKAHGDLDVLATTYTMGGPTKARVEAFFAAMSESARAYFGTPEKLSAYLHSFAPWNTKAKSPDIVAFRTIEKDEAGVTGTKTEGEGWVYTVTRNTADRESKGAKKFERTSEGWKTPTNDPESQWQKILAYFDPTTGQPRSEKK